MRACRSSTIAAISSILTQSAVDPPLRDSQRRGIRVRDLRKTYAGIALTSHEVLKGVDLDLAPGEVVGLIGPNGAGKTTLMSCLLGFLHIDEGSISFDGLPNDDLSVRRRTGFVPERMNLGRRWTGRQFLHYMARLAGVPRADVDGRVAAMLERIGLDRASDRSLGDYSRGMLQRIALGQALIAEPAYLFLDEPTSGLDPNGVLLVRDLIGEEKKRGAMVLLNSHQLAEVEKVCDRVLFLDKGVIARAEQLRHTGRHVVMIRFLDGAFDTAVVERITGSVVENDGVVVSAASEAQIAAIVRELVTSGADIIEVRPHSTDLEAIFRGDS